MSDPTQGRIGELRSGLIAVRHRIDRACDAAGRPRTAVHLIVVTKTYPAADVAALAGLGVTDVGESRLAELDLKSSAVAGLTWHFIGRLQSNKARQVARAADVVHSVDRDSLIEPLAQGAADTGRSLDCLVQLSLDGDPERGGVPAERLPALAAEIAARPTLRVRGLMAVPPLRADPQTAYAQLPKLLAELRQQHPHADMLSAGMSGDLEAAVTHGATHLRVGTAILGVRAPLG